MIEKMLSKKKWAVVGATKRETKFGYQILMMLKEYGYEVYPINPFYDEIKGIKCYPSLKDIPVKVDVVDVVIPPKRTINLINEVKEVGIENIWFQPGTYTTEILEKSHEMKLNIVFEDCVMIELEKEE
ncbi:MAG: CoA-binding protein [Clostridiales bacterium]|nr:CoA-binding protein [Clostridiales bacterium]